MVVPVFKEEENTIKDVTKNKTTEKSNKKVEYTLNEGKALSKMKLNLQR